MDTLLYIDNYFSGEPSPALREEFEGKIASDPLFAEEVAFYLSTKQVIAETEIKNDHFKETYNQYKLSTNSLTGKPVIQRKLWPVLSAAAILTAVIVGWFLFMKSVSPSTLADEYINQNFQTLGVTMGAHEDSMQTGLRLYNDGKLKEALTIFENIIRQDSSSFQAKKFAGIVSLQSADYDKAILYFSQLGKYTQLYANPGLFYQALTLLKRNRAGDKQEAKKLLKLVAENNLEGKDVALMWLAKL